jgi:hypothetical protein
MHYHAKHANEMTPEFLDHHSVIDYLMQSFAKFEALSLLGIFNSTSSMDVLVVNISFKYDKVWKLSKRL